MGGFKTEYLTINEIIVNISEVMNIIFNKVETITIQIIDDGDIDSISNFSDVMTEDILKLNYDLLPHLAQLSFEDYKRVNMAIQNQSTTAMLRLQSIITKKLDDNDDEVL